MSECARNEWAAEWPWRTDTAATFCSSQLLLSTKRLSLKGGRCPDPPRHLRPEGDSASQPSFERAAVHAEFERR